MLLQENTLLDYIDAVDSNSPTPGGGSVAALVGALGAALAKMLANFSVEKKKFIQASESEKQKYILAMSEIDKNKDILINGIDADAFSYQGVLDAYASKDEKKIEEALSASCFVAFELQDAACNALKYLDKLVLLGNKYVMSDLHSGAILLYSCVELCHLNVMANANAMLNDKVKEYYLENGKSCVQKAKRYKTKVLNLIKNNH